MEDEPIIKKRTRGTCKKVKNIDYPSAPLKLEGEIFIDRQSLTNEDIIVDYCGRPYKVGNFKDIVTMLYKNVAPLVLDYDMSKNEAVAYILYQKGFKNMQAVVLMSVIFGKEYLRQNVNDYHRKAIAKIKAGKQITV